MDSLNKKIKMRKLKILLLVIILLSGCVSSCIDDCEKICIEKGLEFRGLSLGSYKGYVECNCVTAINEEKCENET